MQLGGRGGPRATFVCGFLGCDARPYNPLLAALPRFLHLSASAGENDWLSAFPRVVVNESGGGDAGGDGVLTRMAELMFVEVVRRYLATLPPQQAGWLAGLRDPVVSRALGRLHERPAHPWTLAELAREGGASRTVLVERFARLVGMPPMQYLTQWRLQLAAEQLAAVRPRWRRWGREWATSPRRRSVAPSSAPPATRPPRGGGRGGGRSHRRATEPR